MSKGNKVLAVAVVALMLLVSLSSFALAEPYGPTHKGGLSVVLPKAGSSPSGVVAPSSKVTVSGSGFEPNAKVEIVLDGKVVAEVYADANGSVSYELTLPAEVASGIHTVSAQGPAEAGGTLVLSDNVVVAGKGTTKTGTSEASAFPFTGGDALLFALVAGIALVAAGFGMKLIKRSSR